MTHYSIVDAENEVLRDTIRKNKAAAKKVYSMMFSDGVFIDFKTVEEIRALLRSIFER